MSKKWTDEEVSKLKRYYSDHTNEYISNNILEGRTVQAIGSKAQSLNLDNNLIGTEWSESEEDVLREKYSSYTCKEISKKFLEDRTVESIKGKASRLDLNSSPIRKSESESLVTCQLCGKNIIMKRVPENLRHIVLRV